MAAFLEDIRQDFFFFLNNFYFGSVRVQIPDKYIIHYINQFIFIYLLDPIIWLFINILFFLKEPITSENTRLVAKKIHAHHSIECSAKTGENIDKLFEMAGRAAMAHRRRRHTSRVSKWPFSHCNVLWSNYLQPHHKISQYLVMDRIYIIVSEIAFSSTKNWIYLCARLFQNLKSSFQIHTYSIYH